MKSIEPSLMHKIQKNLPLSSLAWALIVSIIVLALAASASAQNSTSSSEFPVPPPPPPPDTLPRVDGTNPNTPTALPPTRPMDISASTTVERPGAGMNGNMDPMTLNTNANGMRADFSARRGQIAAEVAARQAAIAEKRAVLASSTIARQGALRVEAQQRVLGQANGLVTALNNAILRLETITNRLKERAHRLGETSYTLSLLYEADQSLAATKEAMVGIETNISFATTSNTPMEDFKEAREQFLQVRTLLTDVRNILKEALTSLKQQEMPQQANTNEGATVESSTNIEVTN